MKVPLVDSHVHLWQPGKLEYPWLASVPSLNRPFLPADFVAASTSAGVEKIIFVEAGAAATENLAEVKWISELAKQEPRVKGIVANVSLERGTVQDELGVLAGQPLVKGVRRLLQGEAETEFCLRPKFMAGVRLLAEHGFTFDLCTRRDQLPAVTELVRRIPEVQFVLDHCGKPNIRQQEREPWGAHLKALAALPNVVCKISGLVTEADQECWQSGDLEWYVKWALEVFGFDRVMFGSDWPVLTLAANYERWLDYVSGFVAGATDAERRKFFQTNAERIYRV